MHFHISCPSARDRFIQIGREIEESFASWMFLTRRMKQQQQLYPTTPLDGIADEMEQSWYLNEVAWRTEINFVLK